jgi:hypothetical protein
MLLVNTVECLLSPNYLLWRKKMVRVSRHGAQIPRMTCSMRSNACTVLDNSLVKYRLLRTLFFLCPSPFVLGCCGTHLPGVKPPSVRSQARSYSVFLNLFLFFLGPHHYRVFGSADLSVFILDHDGPFDPFDCQQLPNTHECTVGLYGLCNGRSFITHCFLAFSPSFFKKFKH